MTVWEPIPNNRDSSRRDDQVRIRAWEPGDGLRCIWASSNATHRCTAPVAVIHRSRPGYRGKPENRTEVLCSRHVAEAMRKYMFPESKHMQSLTVIGQKAAQEQVLAAHWDEYQEAIDAQIKAHYDTLYAAIPENLKRYMIEDPAVAS